MNKKYNAVSKILKSTPVKTIKSGALFADGAAAAGAASKAGSDTWDLISHRNKKKK